MDNFTDEQLVEKYLKGQKRALEILINRYLALIFNYALHYAKQPALADDLTQEVFIRVWKKIKKFNSRYKFKSWLYTIAKNTCLDYLKKKRAVNFSELDSVDDNLLFEELIKETSASPQAELEMAHNAEMVRAAVAKLPDKYRETVNLRYLGGYKFREISEVFKESIETIKSRNRRALIYLKRLIKK